ncbi:MAG: hypothetical protein M1837_005449 [Sclerophora amabilis]|nr:MAG: hypothetical protein M1837_005449 [Sclerophora amabilis]
MAELALVMPAILLTLSDSRQSSLQFLSDEKPSDTPGGTSGFSETRSLNLPVRLSPTVQRPSRPSLGTARDQSRPSERQQSDVVCLSDDVDQQDEPDARNDFLSPENFMTDDEVCQVFLEPERDATRHRQSAANPPRSPVQPPVRNGPIPPNLEILSSFRFGDPGTTLRPKKAVELVDGDILQISLILQDIETTEVRLRGLRFRRTKFMNGVLEKLRNEVCLILEPDEDDSRPQEVQCVDEVPLSEVLGVRRLLLTNEKYPRHSFVETEIDGQNTPDNVVFSECQLVCRWKYVCYFMNAAARKANRSSEKSLSWLRSSEAETTLRVDDDDLRRHWRNTTSKGGAFVEDAARKPDLPVLKSETATELPSPPCYVDLTPSGRRAMSPIEVEPQSPSHSSQLRKRQPALPEGSTAIYHDIWVDCGSGCPDSGSQSSNDGVTTMSHNENNRSRDLSRKEERPALRFAQTISTSQTGLQDDFEVTAQFQARSRAGRVELDYAGTIRPPVHPSTPKRRRPDCPAEYPTPPDSRKRPSRSVVRPIAKPPTPRKIVFDRKYSFGDVFCGAGGASRGAQMAGLQVMWGVDKDSAAVQSYQRNFPGTDIWHMEINNLIALRFEDLKVDILHLSPPCQYFSAAHTVVGRDDEMNTATFFSTDELLKTTKPRVVSLENTSGLAERHGQWQNAAIHMFTRHGFSVRWRVINCAEFGCAQARKRMFLIASCPGEPLPAFPSPTHSSIPEIRQAGGLLPPTTVFDVISGIPKGHANHNPEAQLSRSNQPYDIHKPLPFCITTSGGGNYHPSGERDLTHREFACLQGFPLEHKFCAPGVRKQIGNAIPPVVGKLLFEAIKDSLLKTDGLA